MKYIPLLLILFFCAGGCASQYYAQYSVKTSIGEFDLYKINQLKGNVLKTKTYGAPNIALNVQRFEQRKDILYSIVIHYSGREWLLIDSGETLIFNIDGEEIILRGKGSGLERNVYYKGVVSEIAYYDIRPEFLKKIFKAKKVELKVIGENIIEYRFLSKRNKKNIKQFYKEYIINKKPWNGLNIHCWRGLLMLR